MFRASLFFIAAACASATDELTCASTPEGCQAGVLEVEDEAANMKASLLQVNLQKVMEVEEDGDNAVVADAEIEDPPQLLETEEKEEMPAWAHEVVANKKKLGLVQADIDNKMNNTFATCKQSCESTGGMCMACGPDSAYNCVGCCCFHWPMGPRCPQMGPNSNNPKSPSYTINLNCVGPHGCGPQSVCAAPVYNYKYASIKPLTPTNVKCSWSSCRQCTFCRGATAMGSWARNGKNCRVSGKQSCSR